VVIVEIGECTTYLNINKSMKQTIKIIQCLALLFAFFALLSYGLNHLQKPNALEKIEERMDKAEEAQSVLTENEKKLKTESETKEWEEVDNQTDK